MLRCSLAVAFALLLLQCAAEEDERCEPWQVFKIGCNSCQCPGSGLRKDALCSSKPCSNEASESGNFCKPGISWMSDDGCNMCKCPDNGIKSEALCTNEVSCPKSKDTAVCPMGKQFRLGCAQCFCTKDGSATCDSSTCLSPNNRRRKRFDRHSLPFAVASTRLKRAPSDGERCYPGIRYNDECNTCICSQDGIKAHSSCTFTVCRN